MANPNYDPRFFAQQQSDSAYLSAHRPQQTPQQPTPQHYSGQPPPRLSSQSTQGGAERRGRSPGEQAFSPSPYPPNQYPPPPQGQGQGYHPSPSPSHPAPQHNSTGDPRAPRQQGNVSSPVPSFSNQVAPYADEKAQGYYAAGGTYPVNPSYSGPLPQPPHGGYEYDGMDPRRREGSEERERRRREKKDHDRSRDRDRDRDHDRDRDGNRDGNRDRDRDKDRSRNPLSNLTEDQRGLGASMLGGAGGALVGARLAGTLGAIGGALVGAIGAGKLEEKRERHKRDKDDDPRRHQHSQPRRETDEDARRHQHGQQRREKDEWREYYSDRRGLPQQGQQQQQLEDDGRRQRHDRDRDRDRDRNRDDRERPRPSRGDSDPSYRQDSSGEESERERRERRSRR